MYLIDTNIFLEVLLDQDKKPACLRFLENLEASIPGLVSAFSLHAIEAILSSRGKNRVLESFLEFFQDHPYLFVHSTSIEEEIKVSRLLRKSPLDFDDQLQLFIAHKLGLTIVTLDKDFKKQKQAPVRSPEEL